MDPQQVDPTSSPRLPFAGSIGRGRPVYRDASGADSRFPWEVTITPLEGATDGRNLDGGSTRPRALFEVRLEYTGLSLPEFGPRGPAKRVETYQARDLELISAIAKRAGELFREGARDVLIPRLIEDHRRAAGESGAGGGGAG